MIFVEKTIGLVFFLPFSVVKELYPVAVPHSSLEESGVPVSVHDREVSVAVLEPVVKLAHILVAVVVEGGPVARLQPVDPTADVGTRLTEKCPDSWKTKTN